MTSIIPQPESTASAALAVLSLLGWGGPAMRLVNKACLTSRRSIEPWASRVIFRALRKRVQHTRWFVGGLGGENRRLSFAAGGWQSEMIEECFGKMHGRNLVIVYFSDASGRGYERRKAFLGRLEKLLMMMRDGHFSDLNPTSDGFFGRSDGPVWGGWLARFSGSLLIKFFRVRTRDFWSFLDAEDYTDLNLKFSVHVQVPPYYETRADPTFTIYRTL